jgi:hypothetical protein
VSRDTSTQSPSTYRPPPEDAPIYTNVVNSHKIVSLSI